MGDDIINIQNEVINEEEYIPGLDDDNAPTIPSRNRQGE